jgi:hypothetical protein
MHPDRGFRSAVLLTLLALGACSGGGGSSSASAPGCADAANIIAEEASAPVNATYLRVQHIGDRGTPELLGEIANTITWDVGALTGLHVPPSAQRGYRDAGPPVAASAFQLRCDSAGFLINTATFSHTLPLVGEGPSASVSRDLVPAVAAFRDAGSLLTFEARVTLPWIVNESTPIADGTAQVSFFYYLVDTVSGTAIAHIIGLYDNRPAGVGGSGVESLGFDGNVAFGTSPLLEVDASGAPVRFAGLPPQAPAMRFVQPWSEPALFRAEVSHARFRDMLAALRQAGSTSLSPDPLDYRITSYGILGEVVPGTGPGHNVALGASVTDLALRQSQRTP